MNRVRGGWLAGFSLRISDLERGTPGAPLERLAVHRCPSGAAFARKHVRYHANVLTSKFELEDTRFGYREGA